MAGKKKSKAEKQNKAVNSSGEPKAAGVNSNVAPKVAGVRCMGCMQEYEERTPDGDLFTTCPHCGYIIGAPAKEAYHLTPGSILQGKYIVGKVLGYGGFGVTYIGYDAQLDRKIAIKEYLPTNFSTRMPSQTKLSIYDGENGEQFRAGLDSFVEEAKRLSKLNELPGTVDIYDSFLQNETGYIVMEYLEGKTVKETITEDGVFEYEKAKAIILKILETLKEVHKEGIIHRDIAPDNIFLLKDGDVRLLDFGASRYATTLHSKSLSVILKPGYAPEEQYRTRGFQGPWSDVYALAATFYKMITGVTPEESMERLMKDGLKEPSKAGVKLPQNDENAIMNALLVKGSDRTQSADEFERQLTAEDEIRRAISTIEKYDAGKVPKWARTLASCIGIVTAVFTGLVLTGIIDLQSGSFVSAISGEERISSSETRVPNVIGEQFLEASNIAADAELLLVISNKEFNDKVETDKVMLQTPLPGRIQPKQSALNVVISAGAEMAIEKGIMPDIIFRTLDEAIAMLEEAGILYELAYEESDTVVRDGIISTSVAAGERVGAGVTVTVVVSEGSDLQDQALDNADGDFYTVKFLDWNDSLLSTQNVKEGGRATAPKVPVRSGYTFTGWDRSFSYVASNLTVRAVYQTTGYTITFFVDGYLWSTQIVPEGGRVVYPSIPNKPGYTFGGWYSNTNYSYSYGVRSNMTFSASWYQEALYTVTFQDWDGTVLKTQQLQSGNYASPPADPSRPGYTFIGWDDNLYVYYYNQTFTAQYSKNPNYTLTVTGGSGSGSYPAGTVVNITATPPAGQVFSSWSSNGGSFANANSASTTFTMPFSNASVTASFAVTYYLTVNGGTGSGYYTAGTAVPIVATPPSGNQFVSWSSGAANVSSASTTFTMPTSAAVVTASFTPVTTGGGDNTGGGDTTDGGNDTGNGDTTGGGDTSGGG